MRFANGSRISAMASTTDAGRGETASLVIMDEADFHVFFHPAIGSQRLLGYISPNSIAHPLEGCPAPTA